MDTRINRAYFCRRPGLWLATGALFMIAATAMHAAEWGKYTVGAMAGMSDLVDHAEFDQYEGYVSIGLPWTFENTDGVVVEPRVTLHAGTFADQDDRAGFGSLGFSILIGKSFFFLDIGTRPTLISEHKFREVQLGGTFQFISHGGVRLRFSPHLHIGARVQHISNAGVYEDNSGFNTLMGEVGWTF